MRRVPLVMLVVIGLLSISITQELPPLEVSLSAHHFTLDAWSLMATPLFQSSSSVSPSVSSPPSVAYVTNISNLARWHQVLAKRINGTRLLDLLANLSNEVYSQSTFEDTLLLAPSVVCTSRFLYPSAIRQGEELAVQCFLNSSLEYPIYVNLSLSANQVGSITKTNLLFAPGANVFHLDLEILPNCPPQTYNLTFLVLNSSMLLHSEQISLDVQSAFSLIPIKIPENALQNQPFHVTINITNLGSQIRAFEVVVEPNYVGTAQVIVKPNETRSITFTVQYMAETFADTGLRSLSLILYLSTYRILSVEYPLYIAYSTVNLVIILIPPLFLISLCVIGVCWIRRGKRSQRTQRGLSLTSPVIMPSGERVVKLDLDTNTEVAEGRTYPLKAHIPQQIVEVINQLGLEDAGPSRYSNDRVILTWEKRGNELHLVVNARNIQLVQRIFQLLSEQILERKTEGETYNVQLD